MHGAALRGAPSRAGLSLVEIMIALAICAMLLTAVGTAFVSSSKVIEHNDQFVRAAQAARISVNVIMNDIRKSQVPDTGTAGLVDTERLEVNVAQSGKLVKRIYTKVGTDLMMTVDDPIAPQTVRLAGNISALKFTTDGTAVSVILTVKVETNQVTMSGSAMPRWLMKF
jgi:prepilin-type N-terminal cleavage/methylation domain-containing protein